MKPDFNNIMRIDFEETLGGYSSNSIALFNLNRISEDKVNELIRRGHVDASRDVIVCSEEQFNSVFFGK